MQKEDKIYPNDKILTINCDASWNPNKSIGGWAFWISHSSGRFKRWGEFKNPVTDSNEAEIKACCNALYFVMSGNNFNALKLIIINCDNSVVRDIINKKKINDRYKAEGNKLLDLCSKYELVIAKVIKGHKTNYNPRQYVNNWCDEYSRKYLIVCKKKIK